LTGILKGISGNVSVAVKGDADLLLPSQTGNSGKFLTTNGTSASWGTPATGGGGGSSSNVTITAGETINAYSVAYIKSDGKAYNASGNATSTVAALITSATVTSGNTGNFMIAGLITNGSWSWTPGAVLYIGEGNAGIITASQPTASNHVVQPVGKAINATTVYFEASVLYLVLN
jgi:hypothetical protein